MSGNLIAASPPTVLGLAEHAAAFGVHQPRGPRWSGREQRLRVGVTLEHGEVGVVEAVG